MKILKKLGVGVMIVSIIAVASGCDWFGEKDTSDPVAQATLNDAFSNLSEIDSLELDMSLEGDMSGLKESQLEEVEFDFDFFLALGEGEKDDTNVQIKLDGTATTNGAEPGGLSAEMRMNDEHFYVLINEVPDLGPDVPTELIAMFMGQWWDIPTNTEDTEVEGAEAESAETETDEEDEKELTPMDQLVKDTKFFKNVHSLGDETLENGFNCEKFEASLHESSFIDFIIESNELQGKSMSKEEIDAFERIMEKTEFDVNIWVDKKNSYPVKLTGNLTIDDYDNTSADLEIAMSLDNINVPFEIEVPADAKPFDMAGMMMGGMSGATGEMPIQ